MDVGKSCRCGGVCSAAAEAVQDGVLQGHGDWLTRQSLRHYDLMKPSEKSLVGVGSFGLGGQKEVTTSGNS